MEFLRPRRPTLSLDMAPLIDIVFQLLIFFMLSSSFLNPALKLNLPKAVTQDSKEPEQIIVSIGRKGSIFINHDEIQMERLTLALSQKLSGRTRKSVHVRGDKEMPYKYFVEVMDAARQAGATQVNIVHEK